MSNHSESKDTVKQVQPKSGRIAIPIAQQKLLFISSAGQCAFPKCPTRGIVPGEEGVSAVTIVEIAHICSYEDGGPRADVSLSLEQRNRYPNLIVMCPTHHTIIDKQPAMYPVEKLRTWKSDVEKAVTRGLLVTMPQVSFIELELVTRSLLALKGSISSDYQILAPDAKMEKNKLSDVSRGFLTVGMAKSNEVSRFVEQFSFSDADFGAKLRAGFVERYKELKGEGLEGDALFGELLMFACGNRSGVLSQAAGLAVLGYFFQACEVFEK